MSRFDAILFENHFAIGSTRYEDHYPGDEINPRIVVSVAPERDNGIEHSIQMIVDTGATWCVLDPEVAESWGLLPTPEDKRIVYKVRGDPVNGHLVRGKIVLLATSGESMAIEATFFVPKLGPGEEWSSPNFLGYESYLSRVRFAVDASENAFYFGTDG